MSQIHLENTKNKPKQLRAEVTATNIIESTLYITEIEKTNLNKIIKLVSLYCNKNEIEFVIV